MLLLLLPPSQPCRSMLRSWQLSLLAVVLTAAPPAPARARQNRFSEYRSCTACVGAGFGWSFSQGRCGAFKNQDCGGSGGGGGTKSPSTAAGAPAAAGAIELAQCEPGRARSSTWLTSSAQLARFHPRTTPFAWTPLWAAPMDGRVDLRQLRRTILTARKTNDGMLQIK